ncbi:MAG: FMN-dependent alpha-hydroxy acid dehydrogenase [Bryobacterales bacterium]|nr:FMN-dependent alpha-hydroxy acid dehydrogenase [Bryobacterales bacterium]
MVRSPMTRRTTLLSMLGASLARSQATQQLLSLYDYETEAHARISHGAWERIAGGAADEITLRWNREAWDRIRLKPRVLVDVSKIDTRINLLGAEHPFPIILAPTGGQGLIRPEGDVEAARGAAAARATYVISSSAGLPVDQIARSTGGSTWFQLYVQKDRGFTRALVQRAEDSGCRALCVTVDSPTFGLRNREERAKGELPERQLPNLMGKDYLDPTLTWKDIEWLQGFARRPILLKGILNPDDAAIAARSGVAGVIVSNHGARNLDTVPATIEVLPQVIEKVAGRVPVIVDGGIRRGTDIVKALATGAAAVQIGRPYLWGLGVAGAEGVTRVVEILRKELELSMALMGRPTIKAIDRSAIWYRAGREAYPTIFSAHLRRR